MSNKNDYNGGARLPYVVLGPDMLKMSQHLAQDYFPQNLLEKCLNMSRRSQPRSTTLGLAY